MAGLKKPIDNAIALLLLNLGYERKRIAQLFDCDTGRITEIAKAHNLYVPGSLLSGSPIAMYESEK